MKDTEVSIEQFAAWSKDRDAKIGLRLTDEDYREEAIFYLGQSRENWPCDIMVRLPGEHEKYHGQDCKPEAL